MNKKKLLKYGLAGFSIWAGRKAYQSHKKKKERQNVYTMEVRTPTKKALKEDFQDQKKELVKEVQTQPKSLLSNLKEKFTGAGKKKE